MDGKLLVSIIALVISCCALYISSLVAWRDRVRIGLIATRDYPDAFAQDSNPISDVEVLAIQVINKGRRPFTVAARNPLRLILGNGKEIRIPDEAVEWGGLKLRLATAYGQPLDGRMNEGDSFVVLVNHRAWDFLHGDEAADIEAVRIYDNAGRYHEGRLSQDYIKWFNGPV